MNFLLNERPAKYLLAIARQDGTKSINELGKGIYNTYKSRYELYLKFKEMGIIDINEDQREVIITLNDRGKKVLSLVNQLMSI